MPRTPQQAENDKEWRTVRIPLETLEGLDAAAAKHALHRNELVRRIVDHAIENAALDAILDDHDH
jgi:predicted DNA-binding protein